VARTTIYPSKVAGELVIPPSKSQTLRAILFAALGDGKSRIDRFLHSPDVSAMIEAMKLFGATIDVQRETLRIDGIGALRAPVRDVIQCGNSGIVLRFLGAVASLLPTYTVLTGDESIRSRRPIAPLIEGLQGLGALAVSARNDNFAPLIVRGPWIHKTTTLDGADSQPVSGLLIAGALAPGGIELNVRNPGEMPWIEMTLHWFRKLGIRYEGYKVFGGETIRPFEYAVPGDFSTAAFPIAAALLTDSELTLHELDWNEPQGDKAFISIVQQMGARVEISGRTVTVRRGGKLRGCTIDVNQCIDALPVLAVLGCKAEGTTKLVNGHIARHKESDRVAEMAFALRAMGASVEEKPDGLEICQSRLKGTELSCANDHRIALALATAALNAEGPTTLHGTECAAKTYSNWETDFRNLGVRIE